MSNTPILSAQKLSKGFSIGGETLQVLGGASIELQSGEAVALMGASGTGKSTLLHLLGLLDKPDQGTILLDGREVQGLSQAASSRVRAEKIGFVFQQFQLLPELNALENVLMPRRLVKARWWPRRKKERLRALTMLEKVGLSHRLAHKPNEMSGGEQQRVAIARALISSPKLLLADEPTGNLDRQTGIEVLQLLLDLASQEKSAVLLATHNESVASQCSRTLRLHGGRLESME